MTLIIEGINLAAPTLTSLLIDLVKPFNNTLSISLPANNIICETIGPLGGP